MSDVFKKEQNRDGKIELTEYNGNTTKVLIPDDVYEIGWEVFKDHTEVEEVVFPEGLEVIGYGAFEGCTGLKEVRFPNSIGSIDVGAFSDCTSLEKAEFSETHKSELWDLLGSSAFSGCSSLKEFRIPAESGNIPGNLFEGCDSLEKVIIEDRSVLILGKKPRDVCEPLKNAALPQQLDSPELKRDVMAYAAKNILAGDCDDEYKDAWIKYIKSQRKPCFEQIKGNKSLSELVIKEKILKPEELGAEPEKKEVISYDISYKEARSRYNFSKRNTGYSINDFNKDGRIDGPLLPDYNYVFSKYAEDKSKTVFIPNTIDGKPVGHVAVKTLPFDAVVLCDAATFSKLDRKVKASTSVAYLEDSTPFKEDEAGKILEFIRKNPLDVAKALTSSDSPAAFSRYLELGKPKKDTIGQIIDSVKDKKEIVATLLNASGMDQGAPELDLAPKKQLSVAEIKKEWNYDKRDLEINGEWVTGIYLKKYKGIDPNVEVLDIIGKAPVLAVGAGAFEGNTGIESVTVPACVKIIERNAFKGCSNLRSVRILGENVVIGDNAFCDGSRFEEIVIDASTTKFGNHPFKGCTKMLDDKGLVILEAEEGNVLVDSKWPFDYSEITVPEGVVRIDGQAFADQTEGWKIEKENLILRRVILPSTIKEIGNSVFEGCEILQSVEMPEGLEKIRERAFRGCKMLREIRRQIANENDIPYITEDCKYKGDCKGTCPKA